jgi:hypothetical protein
VPRDARVALHRFQRGPQGGGDISAWLGPGRLAFQPIITCTVTDPIVWVPPAPTVAGSVLSLHACVFARALVRVALFLYPLVCYSSSSPVVSSVIFLIRFGCFVVSILLWLLLCLGWFATSLFWYLCFLCVSPWWLFSLFVMLVFLLVVFAVGEGPSSLVVLLYSFLHFQQITLGEMLDVVVHILSDELPLFFRPN